MITGRLFYEAFHAAMPLVPYPSWDQLTDWQQSVWNAAARILERRLHSEL